MTRLALILALCAPAAATAAPADMTPPYCAALLSGPPPETIDQARSVLRCERLASAAALDTCAAGLRQARAEMAAVPPAPSRAGWFVAGAAVAVLAVVLTVQAAP